MCLLSLAGAAFCGTTGIISGTVTDSATGEKLAGVNVIVEGTSLTTVTNKDGYYVITNVPPGDYKVFASLVGYSDFQVAKVSVLMDATSAIDCALAPAVAQEETVIVKESRPMIRRDMIPTTYIVDDKQEQMVRSQATNMYQTPALVLTQPGVVADAEGYPHIRGGRGNDIGYMLDGIPITETVTNGFGTNITTLGLDKMEIFTGGYRPEYGNAISGIFNQVVKTGRTAPGASLEVMGGSDAFSSTYPQIGGSGLNGLDYYMAGYLWHSEFEGQRYNEAAATDYLGKFNYDLSNKNKLTILTGGGGALYLFPELHTQTYGPGGITATSSEQDHNHQEYTLNALTLTHTVNPASFFTLRPYVFRNEWTLDALHEGGGMWWDAGSQTFGLQLDYTNQISEKHLLKAGATRMSSQNRYWVNIPDMGYEYTANTDTLQTGLYIQDQMRLSPKWRAEAGLRYDSMHYDKVAHPDTNESQLSPRFGLSYALDPKTNLRFSYGRMIQFVYTQAVERVYTDPSWEEFYGLGNADVRPERTTQYDLGWERQVSDNYSLQITPFYRQMQDLLQFKSLDPGGDPTAPPYVFDNLGKGQCTGVEMMFKKRASNNWSGWLSYTYSIAKAEASTHQTTVEPGVTQYVNWDQRHTAVLVLNYTKSDWVYSLMGEYGSGLPYTLAADTTPNTRRLSPRAVLNLNISREVKGGWLPAGTARVGVANLFNSTEVLARDSDGKPTARVPSRFVNMSYTRRF